MLFDFLFIKLGANCLNDDVCVMPKNVMFPQVYLITKTVNRQYKYVYMIWTKNHFGII